jgi:hypothetical protein
MSSVSRLPPSTRAAAPAVAPVPEVVTPPVPQPAPPPEMTLPPPIPGPAVTDFGHTAIVFASDELGSANVCVTKAGAMELLEKLVAFIEGA